MSVALTIGLSVTVLAAIALAVWRRPALGFAQQTASFTQNVKGELRKVTWPTWEDLRRSTTIITIFVIIIGVVIGIMDVIFSLVLIRGLGSMFG